MATKRLRPVHPGDILRHDFMEPLKLTAYRVAKDLGVSAPTVNEIVRWRKLVAAEDPIIGDSSNGTPCGKPGPALSSRPADVSA